MTICTICGGSGIQRVSSQRFRTCQACLGTGRLNPALQVAPLSQIATSDASMSRLEGVPQKAS